MGVGSDSIIEFDNYFNQPLIISLKSLCLSLLELVFFFVVVGDFNSSFVVVVTMN